MPDNKRLIALSPALLIAAANMLVGIDVDDARDGQSRGPIVRAMLRAVNQPMDHPWHAAFVSHVGYWSHYDHRASWSSWPLPMTADADALARFADEEGILSAARPEPGEVFLLWAPARRMFVHSGFVVSVRGQTNAPGDGKADAIESVECVTVEGNTTELGQLHGTGVHRTTRVLHPAKGDRFIRWVDFDRRAPVTKHPRRSPLHAPCGDRMHSAEAA